MKKLINDPQDVVRESLAGLAAAHADILSVHSTLPMWCGPAPRSGARWRSSRAAAAATSRCTPASSARACWTPPAPARSSLRPPPTRSKRPRKAVDGGAGVLHIVKNYTGDVMNFEMAAELCQIDGIAGAVGRHQRRRGGAGQPVHRRPPWRGRDRAGREDLRRRRRAGLRPGAGGRALPASQRQRPLDGHGADLLHGARRRQAHLRPRRGRDRDGHRHPRRAGPRAPASGSAHEIAAAAWRRDHRRPAVSPAATASLPWSTAWAARR